MLLFFAPAALSDFLNKRPPRMDGTRRNWGETLYFFVNTFLKGFAFAAFCCLLIQYSYILYSFAFYSSFFRVMDIQTSEVSPKVKNDVQNIVKKELGVSKNLISVSRTKIKEALLKNPKIGDAEISLIFPDKIRVNVTERAPRYFVVNQGEIFSADPDGNVISKVTSEEMKNSDFCFITGNLGKLVCPGVRIENETFGEAVFLIRMLEKMNTGLFKIVSEITITDNNELFIYTKSGAEIRLGKELSSKRLARLEAFIRQIGSLDEVLYVDLRFDKQVPYKLKKKPEIVNKTKIQNG